MQQAKFFYYIVASRDLANAKAAADILGVTCAHNGFREFPQSTRQMLPIILGKDAGTPVGSRHEFAGTIILLIKDHADGRLGGPGSTCAENRQLLMCYGRLHGIPTDAPDPVAV